MFYDVVMRVLESSIVSAEDRVVLRPARNKLTKHYSPFWTCFWTAEVAYLATRKQKDWRTRNIETSRDLKPLWFLTITMGGCDALHCIAEGLMLYALSCVQRTQSIKDQHAITKKQDSLVAFIEC